VSGTGSISEVRNKTGSVVANEGLQTYIKTEPKAEGEVIPLYEGGGTVMMKEPIPEPEKQPLRQENGQGSQKLSARVETQTPGKEEEPAFMKYMRGVNFNVDDKAYL
jgi:hypothetical protein